MLVLTRRVGDIIAIGDNIKVIVVSINGKQVRLGIEADRSTIVHREEIYQKIKKENKSHIENESQADAILHNSLLQPEKKTVIIRKNSYKDMKNNDVN